MSALAGSASPSVVDRDALVGAADGAAEHHRRRGGQMPAQPLERRAELPWPRPRDRIVERDDEAGGRRGIEPALDQLPGLEIVGERDRAEIVAERRADPGRDREHRRHAGHDDEIQRAPAARPRLDLRAHRGRHGEHAGIAAGDDRDLRALCRMAERRRRRARPPRDCRRRGGPGRRARERGRDRGRSRRPRRRQRARRRPPA